MSESRPPIEAGQMVTPTVRLVSPLGSGGMGAVWVAEHTGLHTRVVVKFMHDDLGASSSARARFSREAAAAAKVKSPHVVQMLDHGVTDAGAPFIVMEHLEGRNLAAVLRDRGALEPSEVVAIVLQMARALSRVHAAGMLHRDIKPENVFLCDEGGEVFVKLLDFGIAKAHFDDDEALTTTTGTGQIVGTPFYMSPEQMTAEKDIDERSDVWSLGIVAYECMTGTRPFDGASFGALVVKIATSSARPPSQVNAKLPGAVDAWFSRACARDPQDRYATAKDLAEALRAAFDGIVVLPAVANLLDTGPRTRIDVPGDAAHESKSRSFVLASTIREDTGPAALSRSEPSAKAQLGADGPPRSSLRIPLLAAGLLGIALGGFYFLSRQDSIGVADTEDASTISDASAMAARTSAPKHGALHTAASATGKPLESSVDAGSAPPPLAHDDPGPLPVFTATPGLDAAPAIDAGKNVQSAYNEAGAIPTSEAGTPSVAPAAPVAPADAGPRAGHDDPPL